MSRMSRALVALAGLLAGSACLAADPGDDLLATYRDYSINAERDRPIRCKPGDVERFPARTMAQVFGDAWPAQPTPLTTHRPAEVIGPGTMVSPRGLESQFGLVTVATLVGRSGRVLQVEPICMTSASFAIAAKRAARTARYQPALVNGEPVTSVAMQVYVFRPAAGKPQRSSQHR